MEAPSKTKALSSHFERPDRFFLQICNTINDLNQLQENLQDLALSLPQLVNFNTVNCIVCSVNHQWYRRAVILEWDTKTTSVLYIDYGNMETIHDKRLIKSTNEELSVIPPYAIPCALPLEVKDGIEWSECELLKSLITNGEVEFEYICEGKYNNFVNMYHGERDILQELTQNGYGNQIVPIRSGSDCYICQINSMSDFYIHMTSDTEALLKVSECLLDETKLEVMADIKGGVLCAAKRREYGPWYRGKVRSHKAGATEVFLIDYGYTAFTNQLRTIPTEIANVPSLAKNCSMVKPEDIQRWSENAEKRFVDLTKNGKKFVCDVISPGRISVVDLSVNGNSIQEEIVNLQRNMKILEKSERIKAKSERIKAFIIDGSVERFYIQLQEDFEDLDRMLDSLYNASQWPVLADKGVGQMCAALYDGDFYRARILSLTDNGALVFYIDYGNQAVSTNLRTLPEDLQDIRHLAVCCSLECKNGTYSHQLKESPSSPSIVQLYRNGVLFADSPIDSQNKFPAALVDDLL